MQYIQYSRDIHCRATNIFAFTPSISISLPLNRLHAYFDSIHTRDNFQKNTKKRKKPRVETKNERKIYEIIKFIKVEMAMRLMLNYRKKMQFDVNFFLLFSSVSSCRCHSPSAVQLILCAYSSVVLLLPLTSESAKN